jgi:hypothetical protein
MILAEACSPSETISWPMLPDVYPDECPELDASTDHDPDAADERWWAEQVGGGWLEGAPDPTDATAFTVSAFDYHHAMLDPAPPSLSDDHGDAIHGWAEGVTP